MGTRENNKMRVAAFALVVLVAVASAEDLFKPVDEEVAMLEEEAQAEPTQSFDPMMMGSMAPLMMMGSMNPMMMGSMNPMMMGSSMLGSSMMNPMMMGSMNPMMMGSMNPM